MATIYCICQKCGKEFGVKGRSKDEDYIKNRYTLCPECFEKEKEAKKRKYIEDVEKEFELPELTGSEKQIAYARKLRADIVMDVMRSYSGCESIFSLNINRYTPADLRLCFMDPSKFLPETEEVAGEDVSYCQEALFDRIRKAIEAVCRVKTASYWIDVKNNTETYSRTFMINDVIVTIKMCKVLADAWDETNDSKVEEKKAKPETFIAEPKDDANGVTITISADAESAWIVCEYDKTVVEIRFIRDSLPCGKTEAQSASIISLIRRRTT